MSAARSSCCRLRKLASASSWASLIIRFFCSTAISVSSSLSRIARSLATAALRRSKIASSAPRRISSRACASSALAVSGVGLMATIDTSRTSRPREVIPGWVFRLSETRVAKAAGASSVSLSVMPLTACWHSTSTVRTTRSGSLSGSSVAWLRPSGRKVKSSRAAIRCGSMTRYVTCPWTVTCWKSAVVRPKMKPSSRLPTGTATSEDVGAK